MIRRRQSQGRRVQHRGEGHLLLRLYRDQEQHETTRHHLDGRDPEPMTLTQTGLPEAAAQMTVPDRGGIMNHHPGQRLGIPPDRGVDRLCRAVDRAQGTAGRLGALTPDLLAGHRSGRAGAGHHTRTLVVVTGREMTIGLATDEVANQCRSPNNQPNLPHLRGNAASVPLASG